VGVFIRDKIMEEIFVKWIPPYSNSEKYQPCKTIIEAERMVSWFLSINVESSIIKRSFVDYET